MMSDLFVFPHRIKSYINSQLTIALKDHKTTSSQAPFLLCIGNNPGCSMKDVSIKMGADKSLVTHAVSHLMENCLVIDTSKVKKTYSLELTD